MTLKFGYKEWFAFILSILFLIDLTIVLDIPFMRQIFGFLFLTILPGLLILQILKLNKIGFLEKFILTWGVSISFLMFFGLLVNHLSLCLGYETPLSTVSLLISFNVAFVVLAIIGYKRNENSIFSLPNLELSPFEKAFLIVPVMFPALSIFGMHVMNTTDNNIILMLLLFLIPIYVVFVCFFNRKFPKRLYPVVIFLISISLLLLMSLRSNHVIGVDTHTEYYIFQTTLDNLHWRVFTMSIATDACLSISLLPAIYQSISNIPSEFLFKILYPLIYAISPLIIYVLSKKYVTESYAFLASFFFMSQFYFLYTTGNSRTCISVLFFALAMMILFSDKIDPLQKRILFIVFMASCMVSHYSTTYIFFFTLLGTFIGVEILSKKYTVKKIVSLTVVLVFFAFIFFWYSQVTETAFNAGVGFIEKTLSNLNMFFIEESRSSSTQVMFGEGITQKGIPHKIEFVLTWLTFAFIGIGIITLIRKYKEMSFSELNFKKPEFLKDKFEVEYLVIALVCSGLLVVVVALPYVSRGYGIDRVYAVAIIILSVFFVIGGITLSKNLSFIKQTFKKSLIKNPSRKPFLRKKSFTKRSYYLRDNGKNASEVRAYLIILLVLIPYFLCVTGVTYQMFGVPNAIILNSEGETYNRLYVHDQESCGVKWLSYYIKQKDVTIYTDYRGQLRLRSQGLISSAPVDAVSLVEHKKIDGYIYLRYDNVIKERLIGAGFEYHNITEYSSIFDKNRIYNNGGSEVYR